MAGEMSDELTLMCRHANVYTLYNNGQINALFFWSWRRNIPGLGINTMPDDALAPKVARASAGMVLTV